MSSDNLNLTLLNIGYSELNANWNWKDVYSPFARIYYVTEGTARKKIGEKTYVLKPNHLYLIPPFTLHDDECDGLFSLFYIHFYEDSLGRESIFDKYSFPIEIEATDIDLNFMKRLLAINPDRHLRYIDPELYDNQQNFSEYIAKNNKVPLHTTVETKGTLYILISRFLYYKISKPSNIDNRVSKSLQYIMKNIDRDISIAELADIACLTKDHFIRLFKKEMNNTPLKYINQKKIDKAQLLLLTTDIAVKDLAFELSVENVSYFNKIFKHYTGKTPGEYRKAYK